MQMPLTPPPRSPIHLLAQLASLAATGALTSAAAKERSHRLELAELELGRTWRRRRRRCCRASKVSPAGQLP